MGSKVHGAKQLEHVLEQWEDSMVLLLAMKKEQLSVAASVDQWAAEGKATRESIQKLGVK